MATIEELQQQVAALSAQVAAITAPPTDYYTSQYDGEEIDAAVTAALTPDTVPTDGSQKLITSGAVKGSVADLAPLTMLPTRNLLDNWDFRNPVNQRGQTSYTGRSVYTVDRWKTGLSTDMTVYVETGYIGATGSDWFVQIVQGKSLYDKTLTFSVMLDNGIIISGSGLLPTSSVAWDFVQIASSGGISLMLQNYNGTDFQCGIVNGTGGEMRLAAVKLELGSISTLANDPPADYGAELTRCKRYFNLWASDAARTAALLEVGAMRTTPVLSTIDIGGVTYYTASADL